MIYGICLILSLFADYMIVIGKSPEDIHMSLNNLFKYCNMWGLEVNDAKTKIVVFRKRGGIKRNENWMYVNTYLNVVDGFVHV